MSYNIDSSEISIVVQGGFVVPSDASDDVPDTNQVVETWRRLLPNAQIILSTWAQPNQVSSAVDVLVISHDPGVTIPQCAFNLTANNIGRQVLSTKAGLAHARRQYAIKTRTDIQPLDTGFIPLFLEKRPRNPNSKLFDMPVVTCSFCTLDPQITRVNLHVSDIFHFGKTADLLKLWNIPVPPPLSIESLEDDYGFDRYGMIVSAADRLLRPEQYIFLKLIQNARPEIQLLHSYDDSLQIRREGECYLFNNFTVRPAESVGVRLPARMNRHSMVKKIYSMDKILMNEAQYGKSEHYVRRDDIGLIGPNYSLYKLWRSSAQNMRIPCWLAAFFLFIQTPNIIFNTKKFRKWSQYRARGRALKNRLKVSN